MLSLSLLEIEHPNIRGEVRRGALLIGRLIRCRNSEQHHPTAMPALAGCTTPAQPVDLHAHAFGIFDMEVTHIMNILYQDLLTIQEGILVQQVNCRGAMGRGLAKAIREKWPYVYQCYHNAYMRKEWQLGKVQFVLVDTNLLVCNLAGQDAWGTQRQQTDYWAYRVAWPKVKHMSEQRCLPVYASWMFGCGLAGGDWNIVQPMIEDLCPGITWVRNDRGDWERAENHRGF